VVGSAESVGVSGGDLLVRAALSVLPLPEEWSAYLFLEVDSNS